MIQFKSSRRLFSLGKVVATPAALGALTANGASFPALLARHVTGDFGTVGNDDRCANEDAIVNGERVFSAYLLNDNTTKVWLITEADRSSTTLLTSEEY